MENVSQTNQGQGAANLTRRGFLGALGVAAAAAAGASLAGCAPQGASANAAVGVPESWDYECDVAVVGSGTVLTGAGKAAAEGDRVIIIEAADKTGGTTATSNGQTWMPLNSTAMADGLDNRDDALAYVTATAAGKSTPEILDAFLTYGPEAIDFLAETADLSWEISPASITTTTCSPARRIRCAPSHPSASNRPRPAR